MRKHLYKTPEWVSHIMIDLNSFNIFILIKVNYFQMTHCLAHPVTCWHQTVERGQSVHFVLVTWRRVGQRTPALCYQVRCTRRWRTRDTCTKSWRTRALTHVWPRVEWDLVTWATATLCWMIISSCTVFYLWRETLVIKFLLYIWNNFS